MKFVASGHGSRQVHGILSWSLGSRLQAVVTLRDVNSDLFLDGDTGFEHLVDETTKRTVYILTCFGTCLEGVHIFFTTYFPQRISTDLSLIDQVTLVTHNYDRYLADLVQLLDPLSDTLEWFGIGKIKDHETGIGAPHIGAYDIGGVLLTSCVPYLYFWQGFAKDAYIGRIGIGSMGFYLFYFELGVGIAVL